MMIRQTFLAAAGYVALFASAACTADANTARLCLAASSCDFQVAVSCNSTETAHGSPARPLQVRLWELRRRASHVTLIDAAELIDREADWVRQAGMQNGRLLP